MKNQGSNEAPLTVEECLANVDRWEAIDSLIWRESLSLPPETETSSCTASSMGDNNPAVHPASQNHNSECTAVPNYPENGVNTVPTTVNLATFEDRILVLEACRSVDAMAIDAALDRLARLERNSQTCMATSDKTLADRVRQLERDFDVTIQNQTGIHRLPWTDSAAPSSNPSSQSAHCSASQSTQSTDQACAKTSSKRDISWAEFDHAYTATLATVQAAAASTLDKLIATGWLQDLRQRLKNPPDRK